MHRDAVRPPPRVRSSAGLAALFCLVAPWTAVNPASGRWWAGALVCWAFSVFLFVAWVTNRYPWHLRRGRAGKRRRRPER
jgi:hypothetical protein